MTNLMNAIEETVKLTGRLYMHPATEIDPACQTAEQEAADTEMLSCYLNEPTNSPERELALMDNVTEFVAIYDKYKHDGIGFLNQFTALLEDKLEELL